VWTITGTESKSGAPDHQTYIWAFSSYSFVF
jgi:hypothetical protein